MNPVVNKVMDEVRVQVWDDNVRHQVMEQVKEIIVNKLVDEVKQQVLDYDSVAGFAVGNVLNQVWEKIWRLLYEPRQE
jgi:hypothetical protein